MALFTRRSFRRSAEEAEALASLPAGGLAKQWIVGILLASAPVVYGIVCIARGKTALFGRGGEAMLTGSAGFWLAVAYIAIGVFVHFHYFWGLSGRLRHYAQLGKIIALMVFVPSFFYSLVKALL